MKSVNNLAGRVLVRPLALGLCLGASLALSQSLLAGSKTIKEVAAPAPEPEESCFIDPVWDLATIVDNKDAAVLQYFGFNGRYQGQYYWLDSNEGDNEDWENRRQRVGFEATLFHDFEIFTSFNLNFDEGDFFDNTDEAYLKWKPSKDFALTLGKSKPAITQEYRTSSRYIITFERSQIVNQVIPDKLWGAQASGKFGNFLYEGGVYSGAADEDFALPESDGGFAAMVSLGYDFEDAGIVRAEWFYNDGDEGNNFVKPFDNIFSASYEAEFLDDKLGFVANAIYGEGQADDRGDIWGIILMPSYYITEQLQVVGRYTYADGDSDDALSLQSRYDREAPDLVSTRAGQYQSAYAGLNYYICGQRLKVMAGVEYTTAERDEHDFEAWTAYSGVRLYFGKGKK
jgi:phosphate-selective porin OprO and OprP